MARRGETEFIKSAYNRPEKRTDGEMYARPKFPDLNSPEWEEGFTAGYDGETFDRFGTFNYQDGYACGVQQAKDDREEMDRLGSSNA